MSKSLHQIIGPLLLSLASTPCLAVTPAASEQSVMNLSTRSSSSFSGQATLAEPSQSTQSLSEAQKNNVSNVIMHDSLSAPHGPTG